MTGPAQDPARCWTCGRFEDAHNVPHPFRRLTMRGGRATGEEAR